MKEILQRTHLDNEDYYIIDYLTDVLIKEYSVKLSRCRAIGDIDEWVRTCEELQEKINELENAWHYYLVQERKKIREETAKEIYENFVQGYFRWDEEEFEDAFKEYINKEYGVKVEE